MIEIPRLDPNDEDRTPGKPGWQPLRAYGSGNPVKPLIRCNCGEFSGIGLHHVHADGRVTASFWHATAAELAAMGEGGKRFNPGCGWHVHLKLLDYDQGDFPPEP